MTNLIQSLQGHDIGHLRIIAQFWGIELASVEPDKAINELSQVLLKREPAAEVIRSLPDEGLSALASLIVQGGRIPWASFSRQHGEIRPAGAGKRDREQVFLQPVSASEILYYRGLLGRAFFDSGSGVQEYAYIPEDLIPLIQLIIDKHSINQAPKMENEKRPVPPASLPTPLGRPASLKEQLRSLPTDDHILDDTTTLLAALRMGINPPDTVIPQPVLEAFLHSSELLVDGELQTEPVRDFLESSPQAALERLYGRWMTSPSFDERAYLPGLTFEGDNPGQPLDARTFILSLVEMIPPDRWWSLDAFIAAIKKYYPDFQRPAGDYDGWFVKRLDDGSYLRGFAHWEEVDGAAIRFILTGPLFWFRRLDLASGEDDRITAFRKRQIPDPDRNGDGSSNAAKAGKLIVTAQGKITMPRTVPRAVRYQISRFCRWDQERAGEYAYQVTIQSLQSAVTHGLKIEQLLGLLARHAKTEIPPALVKALKRWKKYGTEARIETRVVLKVSRPEVLEDLRASRAARFLGETLGPVVVAIKPGTQAKVLSILTELGLLPEDVSQEP